jgi:hypothetical protein
MEYADDKQIKTLAVCLLKKQKVGESLQVKSPLLVLLLKLGQIQTIFSMISDSQLGFSKQIVSNLQKVPE